MSNLKVYWGDTDIFMVLKKEYWIGLALKMRNAKLKKSIIERIIKYFYGI
jgi:hypothetical protein